MRQKSRNRKLAMTIVLKVDQEIPDPNLIQRGADIIRSGGLVVFPTETVYGLGANAFSEDACRKIFAAKERPADNPLIVHVSSLEMLRTVADTVPEHIAENLDKIWPGPVTLLFPKSSRIPDVVTGGSKLVAVRIPANNLALALIEASGVPIAAPSANISTRPSITDSRHAIEELDDRVDLIYDSGTTPQGIESTILDVSGVEPVLLRAGSRSVEDLELVFGHIDVNDYIRGHREGSVPLVPGMKYRHYSPDKPLFLSRTRDVLLQMVDQTDMESGIAIIASEEVCSQVKGTCISLGPERDLDLIGKNLFSALRELEALEVHAGIIMPFPETGKGLAIMNRIRKASTAEFSSLEELEKLIH